MHHEIKDSGLGEIYSIRNMTSNMELAKFLGKRVRYKRELLTESFLIDHGTIVIDSIFTIKEVQKDCEGNDMLRGYAWEGDFGRIINSSHVEII